MKDKNRLPIGIEKQNPILDTRMHEVKYQGGYKESLMANAIAQNLFAQVDEEVKRYVLFDEILYYRTDGL